MLQSAVVTGMRRLGMVRGVPETATTAWAQVVRPGTERGVQSHCLLLGVLAPDCGGAQAAVRSSASDGGDGMPLRAPMVWTKKPSVVELTVTRTLNGTSGEGNGA